MVYLSIPDSVYKEAATVVAAVRRKSDPNVVTLDIERVLRAYVAAGSHGKVRDWAYSLAEPVKSEIADVVASTAGSMFGGSFSAGKIYVNLDIMELEAAHGNVAPNIARPVEAQARLNASIATGRDLTTVDNAVQNVFSGIKGGVESALKGLGINLPLGVIAAVGVAGIIFILTRRR